MKRSGQNPRLPSTPFPTRVERSAQERRLRAQEHLQRVRSPSKNRGIVSRLPSPWLALPVIALSLGLGVQLAGSLAPIATNWLRDGEGPRVFVRGATQLAPVEVVRATGLVENPLAAPDALAERLREHPWVRSARVLALVSGSVLIEVKERVPEAVALLGPERERYYVDGSGAAFAPAPISGVELPTLRPVAALEPGLVHESLRTAISLAAAISRHGLSQLSEITISSGSDPEGYIVRLEDLPPKIVLGWAEFEPRLERLVQLLDAKLAEVSGAERIDLRFANQVVLRSAPHRSGAEQAAVGRGRAGPSTQPTRG